MPRLAPDYCEDRALRGTLFKSMNTTELNQVLQDFGTKKGFDLFVLFGSRARGTSTKESDLDLAFVSSKKEDLLSLTDELIQATHENNIDLVDLRRCDPLVGMLALKEGKLLVRKPGALGETSSYISRRYSDTQKFRNAEKRSIDDFLKKRGLK